MNDYDVLQEIGGAMILRDIYFGGSIISLILLVLTLFIFSYFKYVNKRHINALRRRWSYTVGLNVHNNNNILPIISEI